jgi:hypothetical protein
MMLSMPRTTSRIAKVTKAIQISGLVRKSTSWNLAQQPVGFRLLHHQTSPEAGRFAGGETPT